MSKKNKEINWLYTIFEKEVSNISDQDTKWVEPIELFLESTDSTPGIDGKLYANIHKKLLAIEISQTHPQEIGEEENPDEFMDEIADDLNDLPAGMSLNLETDKTKWYSRGAKIENTGILFQSILSADSYVENAFTFRAPFNLMAKVCNRSKDSKFSHEIIFSSNKGYNMRVIIAGDKDTQTVTMGMGSQTKSYTEPTKNLSSIILMTSK